MNQLVLFCHLCFIEYSVKRIDKWTAITVQYLNGLNRCERPNSIPYTKEASIRKIIAVTRKHNDSINILPDYDFVCSSISARWQFRTSQIASSMLNRMALALAVFRIDRLASDIFRFAIITSTFTTIGMAFFLRTVCFKPLSESQRLCGVICDF